MQDVLEPAFLFVRHATAKDGSRGLTAFGLFRDRGFGPCLVGRWKAKACRLVRLQRAASDQAFVLARNGGASGGVYWQNEEYRLHVDLSGKR